MLLKNDYKLYMIEISVCHIAETKEDVIILHIVQFSGTSLFQLKWL